MDYESLNPGWIGWKEWLAAFSAARPGRPMLRLSYYTDVIHAALAGHGIALGWNCLVEDLLQQGRLRRVSDLHVRTRSAYFVVVPSREALKPNAEPSSSGSARASRARLPTRKGNHEQGTRSLTPRSTTSKAADHGS